MFCLILTVLILKKINVSIRNVIRLTYLLFLPVKKQKEVLLFPNFQRSFWHYPTRFFERIAKVRGQLLLPKFN
jgi:hypothetical protein